MVAKIDLIIEDSQKHTGEVVALCFDGENVYSGSEDGVIKVWDKNLKFSREITIHKDYPVLSLVVSHQKQLYSSGSDGTLRCFKNPSSNDENEILSQSASENVTALIFCDNILYAGDEKGNVTKWNNNKKTAQYEIMEEVKSIAVDGTFLYTVRENDVIVSDIKSDKLCTTKGTYSGRFPLVLVGTDGQNHKKFIASATRDGKGIVVANNSTPFKVLSTKEEAHSMLINTMCTMDDFLFTAGFDGKVKKWTNLDQTPTLVDEIDTGKCINILCAGSDHSVYAGDSGGFVKRLQFSI